MTITAGIYARVSTQKQDYALQVTELQGYVMRSGYQVVEFFEHGSGKAGAKRAKLDQLMEAARLKKLDVVVVWKLDRFGRSLSELLRNIETLNSLGIRFISLSDHIDTDQASPTGRLMLQILGAFAEFERNIIVERVRAGLAEADKKGRHGGRPLKVFHREDAAKLRAQGMSWRAIARKMKVAVTTIRRSVTPARPKA